MGRMEQEEIVKRVLDEGGEDVEVFVSRHGREALAEAVPMHASTLIEGDVNHRIMVRGLDVSMLEAGAVLDALSEYVDPTVR